jgi:excisionase family DNA binding protein
MPLSTSEAARLLGIHEISVCRAIREGRLKAARLGRRAYMIQREDLHEFSLNHPRPSRVQLVTAPSERKAANQ